MTLDLKLTLNEDKVEPHDQDYVLVPAVTKADLLKVRAVEKDTGVLFNFAISDEWLLYLMPGILYPVIDHIIEDDKPVRALVKLTEAEVVWIEIPREIFDGLRTMEATATTIIALKQQYT